MNILTLPNTKRFEQRYKQSLSDFLCNVRSKEFLQNTKNNSCAQLNVIDADKRKKSPAQKGDAFLIVIFAKWKCSCQQSKDRKTAERRCSVSFATHICDQDGLTDRRNRGGSVRKISLEFK